MGRVGPGKWTHNASPNVSVEALEGSLKRLRLDRIDIYQLHVPDPAVSFEASVETLARLKSEGKIRHVALSNARRSTFSAHRRLSPSPPCRTATASPTASPDFIVDYCEQQGIAFMPWAPLGQMRGGSRGIEERSGSTPCHAPAGSARLAAGALEGRPSPSPARRPSAISKRTSPPPRCNCHRPPSTTSSPPSRSPRQVSADRFAERHLRASAALFTSAAYLPVPPVWLRARL